MKMIMIMIITRLMIWRVGSRGREDSLEWEDEYR
jgi:hypothetical protein